MIPTLFDSSAVAEFRSWTERYRSFVFVTHAAYEGRA